jgi:hypothetical protein
MTAKYKLAINYDTFRMFKGLFKPIGSHEAFAFYLERFARDQGTGNWERGTGSPSQT